MSQTKNVLSCSTSVNNAAADNRDGIKSFLVNALCTIFIDSKTTFFNDPRSIPRNYPVCTI